MVNAGVLKLVDKLDLGSSAERRMGSIPFARTITAPCDREPLSVYILEAASTRQGSAGVPIRANLPFGGRNGVEMLPIRANLPFTG